MRLLVFFASTLRRLAGSIERGDEPAREEYVRDAEGAVLLVESRYEAETDGGPPEHWTRLIETAPPDHWLDLIRDRAPHLLPENAAESDSTPRYETLLDRPSDGELDPEPGVGLANDANETGATNYGSPRPRQQRRKLRDSNAGVSGATWLNRLRFQPPKPRVAEHPKPAYQDNATTNNSEDVTAPYDYRIPTAGHDSPLKFADEYDRGREAPPARWPERQPDRRTASREAAIETGGEAFDFPTSRTDFETRKTPRQSRRIPDGATGHDPFRDYKNRPNGEASPEAHSEQASRQTTRYLGRPPAATANPGIFVTRAETNSTTSQFRSAANSPAENDQRNRAARSGESARESTEDSAGASASFRNLKAAVTRQASRSSTRLDRQVSANRSVVNSSRLKSETEPASPLDHNASPRGRRVIAARSNASAKATAARVEAPAQSPVQSPVQSPPDGVQSRQLTNSAARNVEPPRHRFAAVGLGATGTSETLESMWPTLPPAQGFEMTDELAAMEREVETLRRLDREQRGTLWNA